ncbi:hypothetical protein ACS0OX_06415 [Stenotrophomonas pavanii]|uniref:hypothetical protein n=1 Tax=Stenotrophomonas pavanii TaxID=487698 RepID=UPI003F9C36FB
MEESQKLDVATLYPLVKRLDAEYVRELNSRRPEPASDVVFKALSLVMGVLISAVVAAIGTKQLLGPDDATFWHPIGQGLLIFLSLLATCLAAGFLFDIFSSALRSYRNYLRDIDNGLARDDEIATRLRIGIQQIVASEAGQSGRSSAGYTARTVSRLRTLVLHLNSEAKIRITHANTGALLGALAGFAITTSDTLQKFGGVKVPVEVPQLYTFTCYWSYVGSAAANTLRSQTLTSRRVA